MVIDHRDDWSEHRPSAAKETGGVLAAESRAGRRGYDDIEAAAAHLHGMLEGVAARAAVTWTASQAAVAASCSSCACWALRSATA